MNRMRLGTGFAVFVLFFGLSVLEAFSSGNFFMIGFWLLIGILFIIADNMRRSSKP